MLLVVDVGNTNTVLGVFEGEELLHSWRIFTDRERTSDEYGVLIRALYEGSHLSERQVTGIVISSVVPPLTPILGELCRRYFQCSPLVVGPGTRTGVSIKMDNPREVGADRIVNAVAAHEKYRKSCIVVDFGTATTFDYVSERGDYMGGVIAPGVNISAEALFLHASKLPRVEVARPSHVVGKNTVSAMQAGIFYGYVGLVEGIVERMKRELGSDPLVVATGGLARAIASETPKIQIIDENLTLEGLRIIYEKNVS
jgi:type III pantothenate kinase